MRKITRKKGDPTDALMFLIILFFVAVSLVITLYANSIIRDVISTTALNQSTAFSQIDSAFNVVQTLTVQRGFVLFYGLLILGIIISSFMVRVNPIFIFIYIIILLVAIFTSIYLANVYAMLVATPAFADLATDYTMITWVMQNVVKILLAVGALSMIIIFGKIGQGGSSSDPF
jgi:hypothetical protein